MLVKMVMGEMVLMGKTDLKGEMSLVGEMVVIVVIAVMGERGDGDTVLMVRIERW